MTLIPSDRPELLQRAQEGDRILEFVRPIRRLPDPKDEQFNWLIRRLSSNMGKQRKTITLDEKELLVLKTGGGIQGRSNLNAALFPLRIERSEPFYAVRFWKVLGVGISSKD